MDYEDFELQIGPRSGEGFLVRVVRSPAGEEQGVLRLPEAFGKLPGASGPRRDLVPENAPGPGVPAGFGSPAEVGSALFESVFSGPVGLRFHQSLSWTEASGRGLRLRLRFDARDPDVTPLLSLPWELLRRHETDDFLALQTSTPVVRALDVPRPAERRRRLEPPLRILLALSQDPESAELDLADEVQRLRAILDGNPALRVEVLDHPDLHQMRQALHREPFHVLHFMGHGAFDSESGDGSLLLRGPDGRRLPMSGRHLANAIKGFDSLRLVVLNACDTARARGDSGGGPFAGVATALVLGGLPAVVAMQSPVADAHARAFSEAFYARLAEGLPVEASVTEGRQAIHSQDPQTADWAIPVLFLRTPTGRIFEAEATPEERSPLARRHRIAAALVVLVLAVASGAAVFDRVRTGPDVEEPGAVASRETEAREAEIREAEPQTLGNEVEEMEEGPAPPKLSIAGMIRSPPPAEGYTVSGTQFEIVSHSGEIPVEVIVEGLREASKGLQEGAMGRSVRLLLDAPRTNSFSRGGEPMESCTLRASYEAPALGEAEGVGPGFDTSRACRNAATELGEVLAAELVSLARDGG